MTAATSPEELASACRLIFGPAAAVSADFVACLTLSQVKQTFRRRALESHPDRAALLGGSAAAMSARFKALSLAYSTLCRHLGRVGSPRRNRCAGRGRSARPAARRGGTSPGRRSAEAEPHPADRFWTGALPDRPLPLGRFLFYSGRICWDDLIRSVAWQRQQRPRFGRLAVTEGHLSPADLARVVHNKGRSEALGEAAVRLRCMTPHERDVVLRKQRRLQPPVGQFFVEQGLLRSDEVTQYVRQQQQHNARFCSTAASA